MKKILTFVLAFCLIIPVALGLTACGHKHDYDGIVRGYDELGNYCTWEVCDCDKKGEKTIVVNAVAETNAVLAGDVIKESGTVSSTYTVGKSFNDVVDLLSARCAAGTNVSTIKTTVGSTEKTGIAISGNIKLTEDIVIGYNGNTTLAINIYGNTTIDLNGHSITQRCGTDGWSQNLFNVREGATLNIIDSSENHNGLINAVCVVAQIDAGGTMNLYDGTLKAAADMTLSDVTPADDPMSIHTIRFTGDGTFNMYGGKVETVATRGVNNGSSYTHTKWNWTFTTIYGRDLGNVNVYGGVIVGDTATQSQDDGVDGVDFNDYRA